MSTADIIAVISVVVAIASLVVAFLQLRVNRRRATSERERVAEQRQRIAAATTAVAGVVAGANLVVQRSKDENATTIELGNLARIVRGNASVLLRQLENNRRSLERLEYGPLFRSAPDGNDPPADDAEPDETRG